MGILLDLLKAAAGEASLHSRLGLWRQKVSDQLDNGSAAPADFIQSKNDSGEQAGVTSGVLVLQWVDESNTPIPSPDAATSSRHRPMTSTIASSEDSVIDAIYTVPSAGAPSRVKLRCIAATGTATLPQNGMSASIVEIK